MHSNARMQRRTTPATKFDAFLRANKLKPSHVARVAGCSRQHLLAVRKGQREPTRALIRALRIAAGRLLARDVDADELFDL